MITGYCILLALAAGFDHSPWDSVLKRFVNAVGEVDYAAIKAEPAPIDACLAAIASVNCPRLDRDAFLPATLDAHLDRLTRQFLSERRNLVIDAAHNRITLSSLFKWYGAAFQSVPAFLARYVPDLASLPNSRLRYFEYDWSINEPGSRRRSASPFERELAAGHSN